MQILRQVSETAGWAEQSSAGPRTPSGRTISIQPQRSILLVMDAWTSRPRTPRGRPISILQPQWLIWLVNNLIAKFPVKGNTQFTDCEFNVISMMIWTGWGRSIPLIWRRHPVKWAESSKRNRFEVIQEKRASEVRHIWLTAYTEAVEAKALEKPAEGRHRPHREVIAEDQGHNLWTKGKGGGPTRSGRSKDDAVDAFK